MRTTFFSVLTTLGLGTGLVVGATGCDGDDASFCDPDAIGTICTIAGSGENGYDRDADSTAIPSRAARFSLPQDTLAAPDGSVYILDWNNHRLRHLRNDGNVHWVAGRGELGGTLDDPGSGDFNHPTNIIFDATGANIIIAAWHNSKIRTISTATGAITDSCGDGRRAYFGDEGPALTAALDLPASIALDPTGQLVIMDQANQVLRTIDASGNIHRLAGRCIVDAPAPMGPGPCAAGVMPTQCPPAMMIPSGKFVCGDPMMFCSRPCTPGYAGDEGPATEMRMSQPFGQAATPAGRIAYDAMGNLYFADTGNHIIRKIDTAGIVHRVAGQPPMAGTPQRGYSGDGGPAIDALLDYPVDLAISEDGTIYFTDVHNHCVRAIGTDGNIRTAAGRCGMHGFSGDGAAPEQALMNIPFGISYSNGRLYIADTGNSVIRSIRLR